LEPRSEALSESAHVICVAPLAQLAHARATIRSVRRAHPEWTTEIVLIATRDRAAAEAGDVQVTSVVEVLEWGYRAEAQDGCAGDEVVRRELELQLARHHPEALVQMLVPQVLQWCGSNGRPTIHLPAGTWVLGRLEPLLAAVMRSGVALVSRVTRPLPDDGELPDNSDLRAVGRLATDLIAVGGSASASDFLRWWTDHVRLGFGTLDGRHQAPRPEGREFIHRSLALAPALFGAEIVEDPGCNLSIWNMHEHSLAKTPAGIVVDGRVPLRLVVLVDYAPDRPHELSPRATRHRLSRLPVLRSICVSYAGELRAAGWPVDGLRSRLGEPLADGLTFDDALYALYRIADATGAHLGDIFSTEGSAAFVAWLTALAPLGAASGISRYLLYRVLSERPDVVAAFPDLDGSDGPLLAAWCHLSGRSEMAFPDALLPPLSDGPQPGADRPSAGERRPAPEHGGAGSPAAGGPDAASPQVRVSGYLGHVLGLGAAARGYARALAAAGVEVCTLTAGLPSSPEAGDGYGRERYQDHLPRSDIDAELICINADELPWFMKRFGGALTGAPRIGVWAWETDRIPTRWERSYRMLDEIWVNSRFMAENIGAASPIPVMALPPAVTTPSYRPPLRLGVPDGFLYLFMFDYHSSIQRKNPVGLIEAFRRAFADGEGPRLLIKTFNAPKRPIDEERLLWAIGDRSDIHLVDASLTAAERDAVLAACDCYVSLHRSEGFGLTLAEAMAVGKPVIGTGYSGNLDFMNDRNSFLVNYKLTRVGPDALIYPADGTWAEPDLDHAAALLRRVHDDPDGAARIARQARQDIARALSEHATGQRMRRRLGQLIAGPALAR
jgi:glycosyltransferase involved in cell wall biosynthesis